MLAAVLRHDELPLIRVGERHGKRSHIRHVCSDDLVDDTLEFRLKPDIYCKPLKAWNSQTIL